MSAASAGCHTWQMHKKYWNWQTAPFTISILNYHFTRLSYMCIEFLCISWCKSSLDSQGSLLMATPTTSTPVPFWSPHPGTAMMKPPPKVFWWLGILGIQWAFHGARLLLATETYSRGVIKIEIIQYVCIYIYTYICSVRINIYIYVSGHNAPFSTRMQDIIGMMKIGCNKEPPQMDIKKGIPPFHPVFN